MRLIKSPPGGLLPLPRGGKLRAVSLPGGGVGVARRTLRLYGIQQLAKRLPHDPRDLHLRDAKPAADLVLVQVLLETETKHRALPVGQRGALGGELSLDPVVA